MKYYTIYMINGNEAEIYGKSIEIDDDFLTIFDQDNKIVGRFKWAHMIGFTTT